MTGNLERRLALLKARIGAEAVTLHMADGSVREIRGTPRHYFELCALLGTEGDGPLYSELTWIRDAVEIDEGGRHIYELLTALASGPNTEGTEGEEDNAQ
jgi:hypothetical protein